MSARNVCTVPCRSHLFRPYSPPACSLAHCSGPCRQGQSGTSEVAVRHGHETGEVTLGGRRVGVQRPRVRTADGSEEVALGTYEPFAARDPLTRLVLEQMLGGVSTRRLRRTWEPVGEEVTAVERSVSKSAVSRGPRCIPSCGASTPT